MRRGGEKSTRFDFSTRIDTSDGNFGNFISSLAGLRNNARFDVSRVAVVVVGMMSAMLFVAFFDELGVLRPGVRRPIMPNVRRLGVAVLTFFINFLKWEDSGTLVNEIELRSMQYSRCINNAGFTTKIQRFWHLHLRF